MAGILEKPMKNALKAMNKVLHRLQGESPSLFLLSLNPSTGSFEELFSLQGDFYLRFVSGGNEGHFYELRFPEASLSEEDSKRVHAIQYGGRVHKKSVMIPPVSTARYWTLRTVPVESEIIQ